MISSLTVVSPLALANLPPQPVAHNLIHGMGNGQGHLEMCFGTAHVALHRKSGGEASHALWRQSLRLSIGALAYSLAGVFFLFGKNLPAQHAKISLQEKPDTGRASEILAGLPPSAESWQKPTSAESELRGHSR